MDYFLTTILFLLGVAFHVMGKVKDLKVKFPDLHRSMIWKTFFEQEWDSLVVSGLVLIATEMALFISVYNEVKLPAWVDMWGMYVISVVAGYAGQRIAYVYLGTAEDFLRKKADQLKPPGSN